MRKVFLLLIGITLINSLQAIVSKTVNCTAGNLSTLLTTTEKNTITNLTITGTIDARDFKTMRDQMPVLENANISSVMVNAYTGTGGTGETGSLIYNENEIPQSAFSSPIFPNPGKTTLKSINLPSTITVIGLFAFRKCKNLSSVVLPSSLTRIGDASFSHCSSFTSVTFPSSLTDIGVDCFEFSGLKTLTIPSTISNFGAGAFSFCLDLTSLTICLGIDSIKWAAFQYCISLNSLTIPTSLVFIGELAFSDCGKLPSVTIPASVTKIGRDAFMNCSAQIEVDPDNPNYSGIDGVLFDKNQTVLLECPFTKTGDYTIPSTVKTIGNRAFYNCSKFNNLNIPQSVTLIGHGAFYHFNGYFQVDINNLNYSSRDSILFNKDQTILLQCPILRTGNYTIPTTVTAIGDSAFSNCKGLSSIEITENVSIIGGSSFEYCSGLSSLQIPSSVKTIGSYAFFDCEFTSVLMFDGVNVIKDGAFSRCEYLKSVTIPSSVSIIDNDAFDECKNLSSVYAWKVVPVDLTSCYDVFGHVDLDSCILYVPFGSEATYDTAYIWQDFEHIVEVLGVLLPETELSIRDTSGSMTSASIISYTNWSVNCDDSWIAVNRLTGTGNDSLIFTAEANPTVSIRTATVNVLTAGFDPQTISIVQEPAALYYFKATPVSSSQLCLNWEPNFFRDSVLIVYSDKDSIGFPVDGINYTPGQQIPGGGQVLYTGKDTTLNHYSLKQYTTYYYKEFITISGHYSSGLRCEGRTLFGKIENFPYIQDFSKGTLPIGWSIEDHQGNGQVWTFNNPGDETVNTPTADNGFAILDSDDYGADGIQNSDLISPTFDFSHLQNVKSITLEFSHYFRSYDPSLATLSYSIDNGLIWNVLQTWVEDTENPENYSVDLTPELEGQSQVLFKWNYYGEYAWFWAVDDVIVNAEIISVPDNLAVADTTIQSGESVCFNAYDTITIAGIDTVEFLSGSTVDITAGGSIIFLPGFHAFEGSEMNASITTDSTFCDGVPGSPVVNKTPMKSIEEKSLPEKQVVISREKSIKVYPNPSNGQFKIELMNFENGASITIYNILGAKVYQSMSRIQDKCEINLPGLKNGIYVVKVTGEKEQITKKITVN